MRNGGISPLVLMFRDHGLPVKIMSTGDFEILLRVLIDLMIERLELRSDWLSPLFRQGAMRGDFCQPCWLKRSHPSCLHHCPTAWLRSRYGPRQGRRYNSPDHQLQRERKESTRCSLGLTPCCSRNIAVPSLRLRAAIGSNARATHVFAVAL